MDVTLAYGKQGLKITIPDRVHVDVVEPVFREGLEDELEAVKRALAKPLGHPPLRSTVKAGQRVAIIFSDITRATPYHILIPALLDALNHLPDQHITFFCATGTHRPATDEELETILGKEIVRRFRVVQNDAGRDALHRQVGTSTRGNAIWLNREILEYDLRILTGFIEPHFFAGFSGGGKALMPGMAHVDTIRRNHAIAMLEDPRSRWGITRGNPLWEEITEAATMAAPLFLLNITLNRDKQITGVFAGDLQAAHEKGCAFARDSAMAGLNAPYDVVLTSNSGYPLDLNIYQSVKGMSAAEQVVKEGGSIVVAAECWDGIPDRSDYAAILEAVEDVSGLMDYIKAREAALKDTWQVYFQAMIQHKARVYLYSALEEETVHRALLQPVACMEELLDDLVDRYGPECRICVIPEGPQTIPYLR